MFYFHYPIITSEEKLPVYLVSIGVHDCQPYTKRGTEYTYDQLFYCTKGKGVLLVDGEKAVIEAGMGFYIPACYPHEYYPVGDVWDNHWIIPHGYACERMLSGMGFSKPRTFRPDNTDRLERIFSDMHEALRSDRIYGNLRASGYLYDFLIELDRSINRPGTYDKTNPGFAKCIELINSDFTCEITMDDLCAVSGLSEQHICRLFRKSLNVRPMEYISKRRIQAAKELLSETNMTIEKISETVGFASSSYFCKLFKRYEGITPTQFRRV